MTPPQASGWISYQLISDGALVPVALLQDGLHSARFGDVGEEHLPDGCLPQGALQPRHEWPLQSARMAVLHTFDDTLSSCQTAAMDYLYVQTFLPRRFH